MEMLQILHILFEKMIVSSKFQEIFKYTTDVRIIQFYADYNLEIFLKSYKNYDIILFKLKCFENIFLKTSFKISTLTAFLSLSFNTS